MVRFRGEKWDPASNRHRLFRLSNRRQFLFRSRAIRQLLLEDIAGLAPESVSDGAADEGSDHEASVRQLALARRRAMLVIALDWAALLILVFARTRSGAFLSIGPSEDSIFAIGILAIAAHSGFRLGQLEKLAAVQRALKELAARDRPVVEPPESH